MSLYYLKERDTLEASRKNAGSKARNDVETILSQEGYRPIDVVIPYKKVTTPWGAVLQTLQNYRFFAKRLKQLQRGDHLLVQFPPRSHSALFPKLFRDLRRRGITVTFLIHDLERMRYKNTKDMPLLKRLRIFFEESLLIKESDYIICHNDKMSSFLTDIGLPKEKLIPLGIFDYLTDFDPGHEPSSEDASRKDRIIIAGNLSPEKCRYLTELQLVDAVTFELYGVGYEDLGQPNVRYHGSFQPEELVGALEGDFGLVWDGTSISTCTGNYGNYLRLNDPHKLSLYLTAGIPVVVWEEAAVADFVNREQVGITVRDLRDLPEKLVSLSPQEYRSMQENALRISQNTRQGHYLLEALKKELE